ncbi:hypothetical protein Ancab_032831 [Ancistrocladus abbreviatus]
MSKPRPNNHKPSKSGRTNLASCIVATLFLIFIIIVILIVYYTVFKPKDPEIAVSAVQLPTFSIANGTVNTVNFTFSQYVSVKNPNRALLYSGSQIGFMFIPAGKIDGGRTEYMAATFSVQSFPLSPPSTATPMTMGTPTVTDGINRVAPTIEIESRMEMAGRVRVLRFFTHHVESSVDCRVAIAVNDGSVLGFHC